MNARRMGQVLQYPVRKPKLSPSKITTYLACPSKYRWTYVDDRGKWYMRSRSTYSFGSTMHRVLERFHDSKQTGVETVAEVIAAYEESWMSAGFTSAEEMAEVYGDGKEILERYVEEARVLAVTAKTLFVERQLRLDLGPFVLIGRLDRVDEHEDGSLEIIDYKSGRRAVTEEDVACDVAMSCYQLMLRAAYPDRPIRASIHALSTGQRASHAMTASELDEFEQDVRFIGSQILGHDYEYLTPVYRSLCESCDFLVLCRKHDDFVYPRSLAAADNGDH
ncbi:MAG: PD-(D/E)XK nuclease family protein [Fimbriimonadaceae bacterium]